MSDDDRKLELDLDDEFYTTEEVAEILKVKPQTIAKWRIGIGGVELPFVRFGRTIRYRKQDLIEFCRANRHIYSVRINADKRYDSEG